MDTPIIPPTPTYCSDLSFQADEPLFASATRTDLYLLLEYNGAWGVKAFEESRIPEEVKLHLETIQKSFTNSKLLLIRGRGGRKNITGNGFNFFICQPNEVNPRLFLIELEDYNELLDIDMEAVLRGDEYFTGCAYTEPLFLVCTHGKRDLCCARLGLPAFSELANQQREAAWQSSHIGGHRFAANMLILPHGLLYGRLDPSSIVSAAAAYRLGELDIPAYRGRACYLPEVQAGEYYLRKATQVPGVEAFMLEGIHRCNDGVCQVMFIQHDTQTHFQLELAIQKSNERIYESCRLDKSIHPIRYSLKALHTEKTE